jgi:hypothetical protein
MPQPKNLKTKKPVFDLSKKVTNPYNDPKGYLSSPEAEEREREAKAQKIIQFLEEHGLSIEKFNPKNFSVFDDSFFETKAYPNFDQYSYIPGQHDMQKWMLSVKDIYYKQKAGLPYKEAIRQSTQGWKKMEIYDFLNWLKFHEEGSHMKYKFAQVWYENGQPGYFLHIKKDTPEDDAQATDGAAIDKARQESEQNAEKKAIIEAQRKKIIGRLDSMEKLLRSREGHIFADSELENLMDAIFGLKKKIQLVNKLSTSTRLYEDMIVREANVLSRKGFVKAADILYSVAQTPGASAELGAAGIPPAQSPADPSGAGQVGMPAGPVNMSPNDPTQEVNHNNNQPPAAALPQEPAEEPMPKAISAFFKGMEGTPEKKSKEDKIYDDLEVSDPEPDLMVTEAQAMSPGGPPPAVLEDIPITDDPPPARGNPVNLPPPPPPADVEVKDQEEPLEVTEDDIPLPDGADPAVPKSSGFDAKMDEMLENVTMEEIVKELEDLAKIFKVREIPRRLAIVDMMLDGKGLASFFPQLSEAQNKALDSNNYISTRVEEILSKLRGSITTKEIDLEGEDRKEMAPEIVGIKNKLEQDDAKEKKRKDMRKEQQETEIASPTKETPEVEMGELAPPPAAPRAPAVPRPLG